ncbi:MAG: UDP-N-acetylmuramate--L-alanine ligase [Planctomycetes bacterium]|nr:UDP-N-acetylmuramate--L-alanine ligase [Planctomycetota bacterium]
MPAPSRADEQPGPNPVTAARDSCAWQIAGRHVFLVGIGGCGMNGLARMLAARGAICSGSDRVPSPLTDALTADGIAVTFAQDSGELPAQCDLVIASAAVPGDHPQLQTATSRSIELIRYAQAIGELMLGRTGVSVAGTHGKSTTVAILAKVLVDCGYDPSLVVGATCPDLGGGSRTGSERINGSNEPGLLLAEACEFQRSFHHHHPTVGCILNVEEDHLDIYGSLDAIVEAFHQFAKLLPAAEDEGYLLIGHEGAHRTVVAAGLPCKVETIGFSSQADWTVRFDPDSRLISVSGPDLGEGRVTHEWPASLPGEHNAYNAACAAVLAHHFGCEWDRICRSIESFAGIDRRMQRLGHRTLAGGGSVVVYDDYGHHPTEVDATLRALQAHEKPARLVCVFQPHQHSRTRFLLDQFATSFSSADIVIVPHIYFVRDSEAEKHRVSAADLVDRLRQRGVQAMHIYPFDAIVEQLENVCRPGDLVVVMGAGPVWQVARRFLGGKGSG